VQEAGRLLQKVAIVGAYNTKQARVLENETSGSITLKAVRGALDDAGLTIKHVDGFNILDGVGGAQRSEAFGYAVGAPTFWSGQAPIGIPAVMEAALAIACGECEVAVVASGQAAIYTDRESVAPWTRPSNEFTECWGQITPAEWALAAQEHMARFGTTEGQLAHVAATIRNNGSRNPEAVYYGHGPFTADDVLASRMIASPYHLLDCAMTAEGGSAVVLAGQDRAKDGPKSPVWVLGAGREWWAPSYTHPPTYDRVGMMGRKAADVAFTQAGLRRDDVDVCEFYDSFSWEIIRYFEALRFCEIGEGGPFVTSGVIDPDGKFPICTDGGLMSHSHTGASQLLQKVVQCVRQLRGESPANQVVNAQVALAAAPQGSVMLLGRTRGQ